MKAKHILTILEILHMYLIHLHHVIITIGKVIILHHVILERERPLAHINGL